MTTSTPFRNLLHAANLQHGTDGFTFPPKQGVLRIFFALRNPTVSAGFEPANLGTKGQHATPRPPKPLHFNQRELRDALGKADQPVAKWSLSFPGQLRRKIYFFPKRRLWNKVRDCTYFLHVGHPNCVAEGVFCLSKLRAEKQIFLASSSS